MFNPWLIWGKKKKERGKVYCSEKKNLSRSTSPQPPKSKLSLFNIDYSLHQRQSHQDPRRQILLQKAAPYASGASTEPQQTTIFSSVAHKPLSSPQIRITNHTRSHKPPDAAIHNTHHSQHQFGFTAAKAAPQLVSSSSAPATAHSTIIAPHH